jgi:orotidine-5'-phosphate decarboxylase
MTETFGERLAGAIEARGPLCVGVDPSAQLLSSWGRADTVSDLEYASLRIVEAVSGVATALKPQVAFFERFAAAGFGVLERVIAEARASGLIVIGDAKRGDIDSTNEGYASAWLDASSPLCVDALTVSPYVGLGALGPFMEHARRVGRGVFVLAATSNPEGRRIQSARTEGGASVEVDVLAGVSALNARRDGRGNVGVVIGATRVAPAFALGEVGGPILVPGLGTQGASAEDVARATQGSARTSVLASVSRAVAEAGPQRAALADAAARWRDATADALL